MSQVSPARGLIAAETSQERETVETEESLRRFHPSVCSPDNYAAQQTEYLIGKTNSAEGTQNCEQSRDLAAAIDRLREL